MAAVFGDFFSELTQLDSRLATTLRLALCRPGLLASQYLDGVRKRFLSPITLFLTANIIYFFAPTLTDLNPSLLDHMNLQPYSAWASAWVDAEVARRGIELEAYAQAFERQQFDLARTLVILHVPLLAIGLWLLHLRRRPLLADSVLVAFYVMAFMLVQSMTLPYLLWWLQGIAGFGQSGGQAILQVGLISTLFVYLFFLFRGAYAQPGWLTLLKLPLIFLAIVVAHFIYRFMLFLLVFATT